MPVVAALGTAQTLACASSYYLAGFSRHRWRDRLACRPCGCSARSPWVASTATSLVGPAQVAARMAEFALLHRMHPMISAWTAMTLHPIGAALLGIVGGPAAAGFAVLHGAGERHAHDRQVDVAAHAVRAGRLRAMAGRGLEQVGNRLDGATEVFGRAPEPARSSPGLLRFLSVLVAGHPSELRLCTGPRDIDRGTTGRQWHA